MNNEKSLESLIRKLLSTWRQSSPFAESLRLTLNEWTSKNKTKLCATKKNESLGELKLQTKKMRNNSYQFCLPSTFVKKGYKNLPKPLPTVINKEAINTVSYENDNNFILVKAISLLDVTPNISTKNMYDALNNTKEYVSRIGFGVDSQLSFEENVAVKSNEKDIVINEKDKSKGGQSRFNSTNDEKIGMDKVHTVQSKDLTKKNKKSRVKNMDNNVISPNASNNKCANPNRNKTPKNEKKSLIPKESTDIKKSILDYDLTPNSKKLISEQDKLPDINSNVQTTKINPIERLAVFVKNFEKLALEYNKNIEKLAKNMNH